MWFGSVGSTATAISLSGFQSWLYVVVLQLMSMDVVGVPFAGALLVQRNRSIADFENSPPVSVLPVPVPVSLASGAGPHFSAMSSAVLNGRSRLLEDPATTVATTTAAASRTTSFLIRPSLLPGAKRAMLDALQEICARRFGQRKGGSRRPSLAP
jgi:hypothetical protein